MEVWLTQSMMGAVERFCWLLSWHDSVKMELISVEEDRLLRELGDALRKRLSSEGSYLAEGTEFLMTLEWTHTQPNALRKVELEANHLNVFLDSYSLIMGKPDDSGFLRDLKNAQLRVRRVNGR